MSTFTIELAHDRGEITVEADELTTRDDGSLWLLTETRPASSPRGSALSKCAAKLILARGVWLSVRCADAAPLPAPPAPPAPRPPQILGQATDIPDPLR